ncbi:MAG: DNA primase [Actinomycetota bacterium]
MPGRIVSEDIADLRDRSNLAEIVSAHTQLKKTGRIFKGLCCFHQEKTPSMVVDPEKQLYYCHGCGAGGDVFTFLQKAEGLDFTESAQRLADKLGVTLQVQQTSGPGTGARSALLSATASAAEYFAAALAGSPEAAGARKHLEDRGFTHADASEWKLGYSPRASDLLYRHLLGKRLTSAQIVDSGLALVTEAGQHRDRFRGRIMFPIRDLSGSIIGFGGRATGDEQPKYINSPETAIYHKARILFGLDRAKGKMVSSGSAIVTEGYTDVMALHRTGFTNAVATCGTALGEDHFALIKRFCDRVILAFDADAAGAVASERGFGIHAKAGLEVLVALMPQGKDPADVALEGGAEAVETIIGSAVPLMRFVLEQEIARHRLDTPEGKGRAVRAAASRLSWEPNRVARSEHGFWVAKRIGVAPEQVQREIAEAGQARTGRRAPPPEVRLPGHVKAEREALRTLLNPDGELTGLSLADGVELNEDHFTQPEHRVVFSAIREAARAGSARAVMDLLPDDETRRLAAELSVSPTVTRKPEEIFTMLEVFRIERQIGSARAKLEQLDPKVETTEYDSIFEQLMRLESMRRALSFT